MRRWIKSILPAEYARATIVSVVRTGSVQIVQLWMTRGAFANRLRWTMTVPAPESKVAGTSDVWPCALRWYQASLVIRLLTSREERGDMGGMMGTAGTAWPWIVLWIVLGVALLVTGGVVAARVLTTRRAEPPPVGAAEPSGVQAMPLSLF